MSELFGDIRQIGIVVRDIEKAMAHWADVCGIGPWFYVDKLPVTTFRYRGQVVDDFHISVALANSGGTQLELIQQRCDGPGMYRDFLAAGHEGMQRGQAGPGMLMTACGRPSTAVMKSARRERARVAAVCSTKVIRDGYRNGRINTRTPDDFRRHRRRQRRLGQHGRRRTWPRLDARAFAG